MPTAVFPNMAPTALDPSQALLVKAVYYAEILCEAGGGPFTMGVYPSMSPTAHDPQQVLLVKLVYWLQQTATGGGGGGGARQVFSGHGAPVGLQVGQNGAIPAIYQDIDEGYFEYDWDIPSQSWL